MGVERIDERMSVKDKERIAYLQALIDFSSLVHRRSFNGVLNQKFLKADGSFDASDSEAQGQALIAELRSIAEKGRLLESGMVFEKLLEYTLRESGEYKKEENNGMSYEEYIRSKYEPGIDKIYAQ